MAFVSRMSGDPGPVAVEYNARGRRERKVFRDLYEARRFYAAKYKAGAEPRVSRPTEAERAALMNE